MRAAQGVFMNSRKRPEGCFQINENGQIVFRFDEKDSYPNGLWTFLTGDGFMRTPQDGLVNLCEQI